MEGDGPYETSQQYSRRLRVSYLVTPQILIYIPMSMEGKYMDSLSFLLSLSLQAEGEYLID